MTLEMLTYAWPIAEYRPSGADGYAVGVTGNGLTIECPQCFKPSVVLFDGPYIKLLAARTKLDERYADANKL